MLQPEEVAVIANEAITLQKKTRNLLGKETGRLPEYWNGYAEAVNSMEAIEVHAKEGEFPDKLIHSFAPNMTDLERSYVRSNYRQVTRPVFVDFMNTIGRAFSDNNWALQYKEDDDFREYVEREIAKTPLKMSVEGYIKSVVPGVKLVDAMGCIVIKPYKVDKEVVDGEVRFSDVQPKPIPVYYESESLHGYKDGEYYLFLTNEKSEVMVGSRPERSGFVYELYDDTNIWKIVQTGAKKDNTFRVELYFIHNGGDIPVTMLKGVPHPNEGEIQWRSVFGYAVPLLDDALVFSNNLRSTTANCMFPYRVMTGSTCEHKLNLDGQTKCCDGRGWFEDIEHNVQIKCPSCGGSGLKDRVSPLGVMLLKPAEQLFNQPGETSSSQPAMYYVSPTVDVPMFVRSEIEQSFAKARQILHLRESSSVVKGSTDLTATGMVIDEKSLYSFIKPISDQIFETYAFILDWVGIMRYGEKQDYTLIPPITFDFKTEYDYLMEISAAIKNGLPPFVVHTIVFKYLKTMFYNQLETAHAFNLITSTDRLLVMDEDEINFKIAQGLVAPYEVILHDSAVTFIMELIEADPSFLEKDMAYQQEQLTAMAKLKAGETKGAAPLSPQNVVQSVLNASVRIPAETATNG